MKRLIMLGMVLLWSILMTATTLQAETVTLNDGTKIFYKASGSGQPMLIVPGWTMTAGFFDRQLEHFGRTYRVIVIDPRFQGESMATSGERSYAQQGQDIAGVIEKLRLTNVILVGWSFGCLGTLAYIDAAGLDNVSRYVCIDGSPHPGAIPPVGWSLPPTMRATDLPMDKAQRTEMTKGMLRAFLGLAPNAPVADWMVNAIMLTSSADASALAKSGLSANYAEALKKVAQTKPTLVMFGGDPDSPQSDEFPNSWANAIVRWKADNKLERVHLERISGHMAFWSDAETFNRLLQRWLQ